MLAKDIMTTDPVTIGPEQTIADAIRYMAVHHVSGLPVVGPDGELLGIVTEGDLLRRAEIGTAMKRSSVLSFLLGSGRLASEYVQSHTRIIGDIMTAKVATISPDTELSEIVAAMERDHIKRLPVMQGGACIGIVSRADVVSALGRVLDAAGAGPTDDATIRSRILDAIKEATWCRGMRIDVQVQDGAVTLDGVIFDERARQALRVLASNVPGVTRCIERLTWIDPTTGMVFGSEEQEVKVPPIY
jgi:CBS domain-containing protein